MNEFWLWINLLDCKESYISESIHRSDHMLLNRSLKKSITCELVVLFPSSLSWISHVMRFAQLIMYLLPAKAKSKKSLKINTLKTVDLNVTVQLLKYSVKRLSSYRCFLCGLIQVIYYTLHSDCPWIWCGTQMHRTTAVFLATHNSIPYWDDITVEISTIKAVATKNIAALRDTELLVIGMARQSPRCFEVGVVFFIL